MIYILLFIAFLASDMWVKHWTVEVLKEVGSMEVLPGFLALTYAENKGAAFSMLSGARWFFVVVAVIFIAVLFYMYKKNYFTTWWSKLGAVMIAAGTVGNAIDRMRYGFVVDMFEVLFMKFAIFNVADIFITVGAVFFLLYMFVTEFDDKKKKETEIEVPAPEFEIESIDMDGAIAGGVSEMDTVLVEENEDEPEDEVLEDE
ncbi:MAG: signal peptidase II [Clostridia bacterium]|nr:signal peptidase II [Clostridia bacterium]